jgi:hypothetical protein
MAQGFDFFLCGPRVVSARAETSTVRKAHPSDHLLLNCAGLGSAT